MRITGKLFREYDLADQAIPSSKNFYWRIHPRQREVPYNGVDDDCDGWVDENEPLFFHSMTNIGSHSVTVRVRVNDFVVKKLASKMEITAYRLNNLTPSDIEDIIDRGDLKSGLYDSTNENAYNGEDIAEGIIGGLLPATVYVFQVSFKEQTQSTPWSVYETMCSVDPKNGARSYRSIYGECPTPSNNEDQNRIHTDMYVAMTDIGTSSPQMEAFRPHIVNRAFYEWNLSEMGLVGKQKKLHELGGGSVHHEPFTILAEYPDHLTFFKNKPGGKRYGASYGEAWCSEFPSWVYDKQMSFPDLASVDEMIVWFAINGQYYSGGAARYRIMQLCEPTVWDPKEKALPGDYLAMNSKDKGSDTNHSGILVGCTGIGGGYPFVDGWVWKVDGNCGNAVCSIERNKKLLTVNSDGNYYFAGLGQF